MSSPLVPQRLTPGAVGRILRGMAKPKSPKRKPAPAPAPAAEPATTGFNLRGLTPEDHAALERAAARRSAAIGGGFVSKISAALAVLRAGLAAEDAAGAIIAPPAKAQG